MLVSYADNICKGPMNTQIRPDITWNYLDIMMVFPKQSFKNVILKKEKEKQTSKHSKNCYALTLI